MAKEATAETRQEDPRSKDRGYKEALKSASSLMKEAQKKGLNPQHLYLDAAREIAGSDEAFVAVKAQIRAETAAEGWGERLSQRWEEDGLGTVAELTGYGVFAVASLEVLGRVLGVPKIQVATMLVSKLHGMLTGDAATDDMVELPD